jgi:hypothetical protein
MTKKILMKLNNWKSIIFIVFILGGAFYWYEIRPSLIFSKCSERAVAKIKESIVSKDEMGEFYDRSYLLCLRDNGINK